MVTRSSTTTMLYFPSLYISFYADHTLSSEMISGFAEHWTDAEVGGVWDQGTQEAVLQLCSHSARLDMDEDQ